MTTHTTSNGKVLTAHEATISTAQVEIQTLRVGKKQVTMGMFRQIPYEPLIDLDTMTLRGVPWGHAGRPDAGRIPHDTAVSGGRSGGCRIPERR